MSETVGGSTVRLKVSDLEVTIRGRGDEVPVLRGVSVSLNAGEMHGLVGETGSGKSMTARAITRLLPRGGEIVAGRVELHGRDLITLSEREMQRVRGSEVGMVFQNPRTALHPMLTVGTQMQNVLRARKMKSREERSMRIYESLLMAGIDDAERVAVSYPHELSGGLAQRAVIATALISEPDVLIADEPTTGLDATVQRQILELLADLQRRLTLSVLFITHDLAIIAQYCDSVSVMHDGTILESGPIRDVMQSPKHAYTQRLIQAARLDGIRPASETTRA